jgi:hypothetical protein
MKAYVILSVLMICSIVGFSQDMIVSTARDTVLGKIIDVVNEKDESGYILFRRDGYYGNTKIVLAYVENYKIGGQWKGLVQNELPRNIETQKVEYQQIVTVEGISAKELFGRLRRWVVTNFASSAFTKKVEKPEDNFISIDGRIQTNELDGYVQFHLELVSKEGRYKVEWSHLTFHWYSPFTFSSPGDWKMLNLEDCYPARGLISVDREFIIRSTNIMDSYIKTKLNELNTSMHEQQSEDFKLDDW